MAFIGPWEIALILAIVLILFGPKKLPQLAKSLGDAIRQYKVATESGDGLTPTTPTTGTASSPITMSPQASQTQEKATSALIEAAKTLGIQTEGKTMEQISKEITEFKKTKD